MAMRLEQIWGVWRHGAWLSIIYALGLALGFLYLFLPAVVLNVVLGFFGWGMEGGALSDLVLVLFPLWVPLGLGMAARYASSDKFKPEGYPEHM